MVLRVVLLVLGGVAVLFGVQGVLQGAREVIGPDGRLAATDSVESEFRFFAAWYAVAGVLAVWAARRVGSDEARFVVRLLAAGAVLGAAGRGVAIATVGWPHGLYALLAVIEVVIAVVLLALQAAVDRAGEE